MAIAMIATLQLSAQTFTLKSSTVGGQATKKEIFGSWGCTGENVSPQLSWTNAPEGTKSFAVTVYDPDAPTGSGFWHWLVFNIPADVTELKEGAGSTMPNLLPEGAVQSLTDFGIKGYGGPCPPEGHGYHTYIVTVYALGVEKLNATEDNNPAIVGFNINANTLAKATIVFYYKR